MMNKEDQTQNRNMTILGIGFGLVFVLAIVIHVFSTWNWGVGVSHDSVFYLSAAENFLEGEGISRVGGGNVAKPLTHFPPLYPLSLSLIGFLLGNINQAANWIASFFFAINTTLVMALIYLGTNSLKTAFLGALFVIISPMMLDVHFEAMSEPIYLTFCFMSIGFLARYLTNEKRSTFIVAAVTAAAAYLARYVGVTVVVTGMISLLLYHSGSWKRKIQSAFLYGLVGVIPVVSWYIRNYRLTGSFTNRVFAFHPIAMDKFNDGLLTISGWLLPDSTPVGVRMVIVILFCLMILYGIIGNKLRSEVLDKKAGPLKQNPLSAILLIYGGIYLSFLFLSLTFFDSSTRLNNRILIPLYLILLILAFISMSRIVEFYKTRSCPIVLPLAFLMTVLVMGFYLDQSWDLVQSFRQEGRGFSSAAWRNSEIVAEINRLGPDAMVYTNEAFAIYYLTDVGAHSVPEKFDPVIAEVRENFQPTMGKMRHRLTQPGSALAVFHQGYLREGMPTLEEITSGLVIAHESNDGVIFVDPANIMEWEH